MELVFGETHDAALRALADEARDVATLQELAQRSIAVTADEGSWEQPWRALQAEARALLRTLPAVPAGPNGGEEAAFRVQAGHCPACGWIEAPQPCLGVCVFRPVEMVPAAKYDEVAALRQQARHHRAELTAAVRQLAWVTPRAGGSERTRHALEARAREAVATAPARG